MKRTALAAAALLGAVTLAPNAGAYPGPDGYDSGYCYAAPGMKMGVSNYNSGTGQIVAVDVNDASSSESLARVSWSSPLRSGTFTTSLARVEKYLASKTEVPTMVLRLNSGKTCSLRLDGSM
jgi:hypothetical protein